MRIELQQQLMLWNKCALKWQLVLSESKISMLKHVMIFPFSFLFLKNPGMINGKLMEKN